MASMAAPTGPAEAGVGIGQSGADGLQLGQKRFIGRRFRHYWSFLFLITVTTATPPAHRTRRASHSMALL
ncbi:MAG: hypothetical protein LUH36_00245, partial [Oscillospiraceae bacterium]|nr:hypothetical protein [Oscillospiraceae bacterium]